MKEYEIEIDTDAGKMDTFICHPEEQGPLTCLYPCSQSIEDQKLFSASAPDVGFCIIHQ